MQEVEKQCMHAAATSPRVQEVEKQLPQKHEHIVMCRLSRRQRSLYDDFLGARATRDSMASGSFIAIMNVLMQLRKVCNHPDLFEGRAIVSAFDMQPLRVPVPALVARMGLPSDRHSDWHAARLLPAWLERASGYAERRAAALALPAVDPALAAAAAAALEAEAAAAAAAAVGVSPAAAAALRRALMADASRRAAAAAAAALRDSRTSLLRCLHSAPLWGADVRARVRVAIRARDAHLPPPPTRTPPPPTRSATRCCCPPRASR